MGERNSPRRESETEQSQIPNGVLIVLKVQCGVGVLHVKIQNRAEWLYLAQSDADIWILLTFIISE